MAITILSPVHPIKSTVDDSTITVLCNDSYTITAKKHQEHAEAESAPVI